MGLFGSKKKEVKADAVEAAPKAEKVKAAKAPAKRTKKTVESEVAAPAVVNSANASVFDVSRVIIRPRITEKSTMQAELNNVYVFEIAQTANKVTVAKAVNALYNVTPVKVAIVRNPAKNVYYRGRLGVTSGVKKAYVHLKKGDKIELV